MSDAREPEKQSRGFTLRFDAVVVIVVVAAALLGWWDTSEAGMLETGSPAPDFTLQRRGGGTVALKDLAGKVVVLDFWATWCPPCVEEMPWLVRLAEQHQADGVVFVAASQDEPDEREKVVADFIQKRVPGLAPFVAWSDPAVTRAYGVQALPTLYVIGRDGKVLRRTRGLADESLVKGWVEEAAKAR